MCKAPRCFSSYQLDEVQKTRVADWANIPSDVFSRISLRLSCLEDFYCLSAVCKTWYLYVTRAAVKPSLSLKSPVLMIVDDGGKKGESSKSKEYMEIAEFNKKFGFHVIKQELINPQRRCLGLNFGWLLSVGMDSQIQLIHPISEHKIKLPPCPNSEDLLVPELPNPSDQSDSEPDLPNLSDQSDSDPELSNPSDQSDSDPDLPNPSDQSDSEADLPNPSDQSDSEADLPNPIDHSDSDPELPNPSDQSDSDPELPNLSDQSDSDTELPYLSDQSDSGRELPNLSDQSDDTELPDLRDQSDPNTELSNLSDHSESHTGIDILEINDQSDSHPEIPYLRDQSNSDPELPHFSVHSDPGASEPQNISNASIWKAALSSHPLKNVLDLSKSSECMLMGIFRDEGILAFARLEDEVWTPVNAISNSFVDVIYFKGEFYGVNTKSELFVCDINDEKPRATKIAWVGSRLSSEKYLVESSGDLYLVIRSFRGGATRTVPANRHRHKVCPQEILVYILEECSCEASGYFLRRVGNLGNEAFLLGASSVSLYAAGIKGCHKRNRLFVTDDIEIGHPYGLAVFDWEDGSFVRYDLSRLCKSPSKSCLPFWYM